MANIDIRMAADMSNLGISYGALTSYGSTHITITAGQVVTRYGGHFTFDAYGVYGQLTSVTQTVGGAVSYTATGLNLDAYRFVQMMDQGDIEGILRDVLRGADRISGSGGNDTLIGLTGADTLLGNGGDDLLIGGAGVDRMEGGAGNDRYIVDDSRDVVIEAPGAGTDHVFAATGYRLGDGIERLSLTGAAAWGVGNALDNVLTGTDGANVLNGGLGRDRLVGLGGNDSYVVTQGDTVVELAGGGTDSVRSTVSWTLGAHLENLTLEGTANLAGTGNSGANRLAGNGGANRLDGLAGNDTLWGNGGNDTLAGGAGDDRLTGGAGADRFVFTGGRDVVLDFQDGVDRVALDADALGLASRADVLAACRVWGNGIMVDAAGANDLIVTGVTLDEFRDSFFLI
ncbi:calcium-binding protein [Paracoccus sanguinis]|uniref:calcium-binding protein n=1 Tax=Paracoccus sanguinis TaxID=1545044 RepID=UPI0014512FC2|nr:calcium-binding protein [Paracoccus sanguinis]QJD17685.1 calcium-binding protein [Paracoccus sanguinis]